MTDFHQGPRPETLAAVARGEMGYEIVVRDDAPHGVAAFLFQCPEAAISELLVQSKLHYAPLEQAPVCVYQIDVLEPEALYPTIDKRGSRFHLKMGGPQPRTRRYLFFDPREQGCRMLLRALLSDTYLIEFYDVSTQPVRTKGYSLGAQFRKAVLTILAQTQEMQPNEEDHALWQRAKERMRRLIGV